MPNNSGFIPSPSLSLVSTPEEIYDAGKQATVDEITLLRKQVANLSANLYNSEGIQKDTDMNFLFATAVAMALEDVVQIGCGRSRIGEIRINIQDMIDRNLARFIADEELVAENWINAAYNAEIVLQNRR